MSDKIDQIDIKVSGVVRRSAAWGENKKCRPYLYFIWLLDFACPKFEFGLSEIEALECIISRITDTLATIQTTVLTLSHMHNRLRIKTIIYRIFSYIHNAGYPVAQAYSNCPRVYINEISILRRSTKSGYLYISLC